MKDNRRYYSLDALRGIMMMLGIVLHGSQPYLQSPPAGIPIPTDQSTSFIFDWILHFIHSFRMPLFFLLAGFFTSLLVDKRGIRGTYINRGKRILLPLLVSVATILPLTVFFMLAFIVSARFDTHQLLPTMEQLQIFGEEMKAAGMPTDQLSLAHLWFLYYLLYFYLTIPLCHWFVNTVAEGRVKLDAVIASPLFFVLLCAITTATLWPFGGGVVLEGFLFIKPHVPSLLYYGLFFVLGYIIHDRRKILETFTRCLPWFAGLSVLLFPVAVWMTAQEFAAETATSGLHAVAVVTNAVLTWALIYTCMGLFLRYLDFASPWTLYISNSSYWVYLVHMPVAMFSAWLLLPYDAHAVIKFTILVVLTTIVCFGSYHYLVQRTWISSLLNGVRFDHPWPWRVEAQPA